MTIRKNLLRFIWVLSILVGAMVPLGHEWFLDKNEINVTLPENWRQLSTPEKLKSLDGLLSKNTAFLPLSKIKQFNIRKQLTKMIVGKKDELLKDGFHYSFGFRYDIGWKEYTLLGVAGFASVWILTMGIGMVTLLTPYRPMIYFPSLPSNKRVESLNFFLRREPEHLSGVRMTLFSFLVLEERLKGPRKPSAVWID